MGYMWLKKRSMARSINSLDSSVGLEVKENDGVWEPKVKGVATSLVLLASGCGHVVVGNDSCGKCQWEDERMFWANSSKGKYEEPKIASFSSQSVAGSVLAASDCCVHCLESSALGDNSCLVGIDS